MEAVSDSKKSTTK
jgi:hypothetical protein